MSDVAEVFTAESEDEELPLPGLPKATEGQTTLAIACSFCTICRTTLDKCLSPLISMTHLDAIPYGWDGYEESDINVTRLEKATKNCSFCGFQLSVLRDPDGILLHPSQSL
jgi:hypothetical protein